MGEASLNGWVSWVFDHPVTDPEWYWSADGDPCDGPAPATVNFLTQLLSDPLRHLELYSDAQVAQGLWYIASGSCSACLWAVLDEDVPCSIRRQCIRSVFTLYERYFACRCSAHLSHLDEPNANPLNSVCYMWWDLAPFCGKPQDPSRSGFDAEVIDVMAKTLELDSDACREGALHGLGHWRCHYPEVVTRAIDAFLEGTPGLRAELIHYAEAARRGEVL